MTPKRNKAQDIQLLRTNELRSLLPILYHLHIALQLSHLLCVLLCNTFVCMKYMMMLCIRCLEQTPTH